MEIQNWVKINIMKAPNPGLNSWKQTHDFCWFDEFVTTKNRLTFLYLISLSEIFGQILETINILFVDRGNELVNKPNRNCLISQPRSRVGRLRHWIGGLLANKTKITRFKFWIGWSITSYVVNQSDKNYPCGWEPS